MGGPASGGAVIVALDHGRVDSTLRESRTLIIASALAAARAVVPIAFVLTRPRAAPAGRAPAGAEVIERRGDPSLRLPEPRPHADEVARLGDTLNRMLAALERAREGERRFVADASHELRNPLAALRGNAEYLARHGADDEALDDLREDAERLAGSSTSCSRWRARTRPTCRRTRVRLDELALAAAGGRVTRRPKTPAWCAATGRARAGAPQPGRKRAAPRPGGRRRST